VVEQNYQVSHVRSDGTTFVLGGDVDYSIMFDGEHEFATWGAMELPKGSAPLNVVGVQAKGVLGEIVKAQTQLVAEMCTLRKLRTATGRRGVMYGVLSTAREWQFATIDGDDRLRISDIIYVGIGIGSPEKAALRRVCDVLYFILNQGRDSECAFASTRAKG